MPLNAALEGKCYPELLYEVGREKLREFARAAGETAPVYHDEQAARAAGYRDLPAFPTFPIVLSNRVFELACADPDLGLDCRMIVHGEQEFAFERPIFAGDRLRAQGVLASIRSRGRHEILIVETVIRAEENGSGGETVCVGRSTIVSRDSGQRASTLVRR